MTNNEEVRVMLRRRPRRRPDPDSAVTVPRYTPRIAARAIRGHVLYTRDRVEAWYRIPPQRWSFRADTTREQLITAMAAQLGQLQGRWVHLRVTTRPFAAADWAAAHHRYTRDRPDDTSPETSWEEFLVGEQTQLLGSAMSTKEVYLGVVLHARSGMDRWVASASGLLRRLAPAVAAEEDTVIADELASLDRLLATGGVHASPANAAELHWLLHTSATLGLDSPAIRVADEFDTSDLATIDGAASFTADPAAATARVTGHGHHDGQHAHVAVLSLGRSQPVTIPQEVTPWILLADQLPIPVDWSIRLHIRPRDTVEAELRRQSTKITSQYHHHAEEHGLEPPRALARQHDQVGAIDDELTTGLTAHTTRVRSWWRLAVPGATAEEATTRAHQLTELYDPLFTWEHPAGQAALAAEFTPGEHLAAAVHTRRASTTWVAASVPQAAAEIGDHHGVLLGATTTATRRPVAWDPWAAQEIRDASGLTAIAAGLGSGKSFLGGGVVYKTLRGGARWTLLDPSGPLSRLCALPELAPYARSIDLLNAEPGILNPYRVVPDPDRGDFDSDQDYHSELARTAATRRRLVRDMLTGLLSDRLARLPETEVVLLDAVRRVGGRADAHPGLVIDALATDTGQHANHAHIIHRALAEVREQLSLLIPTDDHDPYARVRDDRLTVLTMTGLSLPKDGTSRDHWTDREKLDTELLNLAAWLTQRAVYERPKAERKGVWIDEAFFLSEVPTGRVLMNRFVRDSRKFNVRVMLSSQIPADFLRLQGFASLVDSVFIGRLEDTAAQADALRLLGIPTGDGYEAILGELSQAGQRAERDRSPRQFVFADGASGVERIEIDFSGDHLAGLRAALDTNATSTGAESKVPGP